MVLDCRAGVRMRRVRLTLILLAIASAGSRAQSEDSLQSRLTPAEAAAVDAAIEAAMAEDQLLGLAIGIIREREIVDVREYGFADRARTLPVTEDSRFRWASCSKPLAAVAAMQLVEQGRLDLDADVRRYVPEFPEKTAAITPRQILCHQSGIPHYSNGEIRPTRRTYDGPHPFDDPELALDRFNRSPLLFAPGARESYSSYAYLLLSAVVQRAGEEPFCDQIRTRIADVCSAPTLQPDFEHSTIPGRVEGLRKVGGVIVPSAGDDVGWKHGAGGYISSPVDFARFARGLIRREFVSEQSEAAMWTKQPCADGSPTRFGLGFAVEEQDGVLKVSHNGKQDSTTTRMVIYPTEGHGMVVMCNCEWADVGKYSTLAYLALHEAAASPKPAASVP